jgi:uncharacterized protein with HEPN domain
MYDRKLVSEILNQIDEALEKIKQRTANIASADYFTDSSEGAEKLDGVCMLFLAVGESLKKVDRMTDGKLLVSYPKIDWKGTIGFRDVIAHQYFDIDAEQVYWICSHHVAPLSATIKLIIVDLQR